MAAAFVVVLVGAATHACSATYTGVGADGGPGDPEGCVRRECPEDACGTIVDGCGGAIDCGRCGGSPSNPTQCLDNRCVCTPRTCKSASATCGQITDGCTGNVLFCGACPLDDAGARDGGDAGAGEAGAPLYCGAQNVCVPVPCTPRATAEICKEVDKKRPCGMTADGCGGVVDCGTTSTCTGTGQTCGGGGTEGICGCKPKTTATACAGACGSRPNGCGGSVYCGSCR